MMTKIKVLPHESLCPDGLEFEAPVGETICDALLRNLLLSLVERCVELDAPEVVARYRQWRRLFADQLAEAVGVDGQERREVLGDRGQAAAPGEVRSEFVLGDAARWCGGRASKRASNRAFQSQNAAVRGVAALRNGRRSESDSPGVTHVLHVLHICQPTLARGRG